MLTLGTHNLTEGEPTGADCDCDILACQEVAANAAPVLKRAGLSVYRPLRDQRQLLAWSDRVHVSRKGYRLYHKGGDEEGWHDIRTPHRGLVWARGKLRNGDRIAFAGTWLLNSWGKPGEDHRRRIVESRELPVISEWAADARRWGAQVVLVMGDLNNVRWHGHGLGPLEQIAGGQGLDRVLAWPGNLGHSRERKGPETGVGTDMRHHSVHVDIHV